MKTELRPVPHSQTPGEVAVELWHDGRLLGCVYGADGPGVRIISKHLMLTAIEGFRPGGGLRAIEVEIVAPESRPT